MGLPQTLVVCALLAVSCSTAGETDATNQLGGSSTKTTTATRLEKAATDTSVKTTAVATTVDVGDNVNDFELTVVAPTLVNSYSQFEVSVVSQEEISEMRVVSDGFIVLASTEQSLTLVSPIVQRNETIDYSVDVTTADGRSKRVGLQIEVALYEHDVSRTRHLKPDDLEGTSSKDYAVFNFGFETVFVNERYNETYCYPTVNDCDERDGSFTADAHNMMV